VNKLDELLDLTRELKGSDLHVSANYRPCIRIDGNMEFQTDYPITTPQESHEMLHAIMPEHNQTEFEERWETDFAYSPAGGGRFRVNIFKDIRGTGGVFRPIPDKIPVFEELGMGFSDAIRNLCTYQKGLIILTGPTGSGKSTTLAAMLDIINRTRTDHIVTIEDPIEFIHQSKGCLVNQREVHTHTRSFSGALRAALREDPDVILLGEMRDLETTEIALETAETGHLVLATLHTNTATSTIDRIIDKFPGDRQNQIRTLLADTLLGVVAQTLCRRKDSGRVVATETLIATSGVKANIRDGKTHQLPSAIQTGRNVGMHSFNDCLLQLVKDDVIDPMEAYLRSVSKQALEDKFKEEGIDLVKSVEEIDQFTGDRSAERASAEMNSPRLLRERAWKLATDRNTLARDGKKAIELAQKALGLEGAERDADTLMVLAAALAQDEDFSGALETVKEAIQAARAKGAKDRVKELQHHLNCYKRSKALPGTLK